MEKKCRYCAMMIPKDAKICPHCRKKLVWSIFAKIFVGLTVFGALIFSFMGINSQEAPQAQKPIEKPIEIISITAEQLYREYEVNEIAADQKYKNNLVRVTGTIRDIGKTIGDRPYLNLSTGAFSQQVVVMFPADVFNDKLSKLNRGTRIELTGTCTGKTLGMVTISMN